MCTLETLEQEGVLTLPAKRNKTSQRKPVWKTPPPPPEHSPTAVPAPQPDPICCDLARLEPLSLLAADEPQDKAEWEVLMEQHHPLGCPRPFGPYLRWFIVDQQGRHLGCPLFEAASRLLTDRDQWIGWTRIQCEKNLHLVLGNTRFLVFPWVKVMNLASHALGLAIGSLAEEWQRRHNYRPVLVETFVDSTQHDGACYRAANWIVIGQSAGLCPNGRRKFRKDILMMPLHRRFRDILTGRATSRTARTLRKAKRAVRRQAAVETKKGQLRSMWSHLMKAATTLAERHDEKWRQRERVLNMLLIMLFIYRLVLSQCNKGYDTVVAELWAQCQRMDIRLPQAQPVGASSLCKARQKLDEQLFLDLHERILQQNGEQPFRWKGYRLFAVDGMKINLPRPLGEAGYSFPSQNSHYPQSLVSCLYRLHDKVPVDFSLTAHSCERTAARAHLSAVGAGDIVVFDRGYFSFDMLYAVLRSGAQSLFRIPKNSVRDIQQFAESQLDEAMIAVSPSQTIRRKLAASYPGQSFEAVNLHMFRYTQKGNQFIMATTLTNARQFSRKELADLYHMRWQVEELYKISKDFIITDEFHGRNERGVRQELYAHFNLIALTRMFTIPGEELFQDGCNDTGENQHKQAINFKHSLAIFGNCLEELVLASNELVTRTVDMVFELICHTSNAVRPGRSFERVSKKPLKKWARGK